MKGKPCQTCGGTGMDHKGNPWQYRETYCPESILKAAS